MYQPDAAIRLVSRPHVKQAFRQKTDIPGLVSVFALFLYSFFYFGECGKPHPAQLIEQVPRHEEHVVGVKFMLIELR